MTAEEMVDAALLGVPALVTIVGSQIGIRGGLPGSGDLAPAVDYERISTVPFDDLTSGGDLDQVRMQVNFWGESAQQASDLAALGREAIAPKDAVGIGTLDGRQGPSLDADTRTWGVILDFIIIEERS